MFGGGKTGGFKADNRRLHLLNAGIYIGTDLVKPVDVCKSKYEPGNVLSPIPP